MRERVLRDESGFTLAELMVTIMIMITVLFALYSIFDMSIRVFSFGNDKTEAVQNARLGLERMEREIRAAYPQDKAAGTTLDETTTLLLGWKANSIWFGNDRDGDRKIECVAGGECETIFYKVDDECGAGDTCTLVRSNTPAGPSQPVVEFVDGNTGLSFKYFERDGTTEVSPDNPLDEPRVALVRIELRIKVERGPKAGTQTLTTDVALRNRGS